MDNGIFVWVNGVFQFGALAPGGAKFHPPEYRNVSLGDHQGDTFVQILREDHGVAADYHILLKAAFSPLKVTVEPPLQILHPGEGGTCTATVTGGAPGTSRAVEFAPSASPFLFVEQIDNTAVMRAEGPAPLSGASEPVSTALSE